MNARDESLVILIEKLRNIHTDGDRVAAVTAIREKCDKGFLPFTESEIQFIDPDNVTAEADAHILALHEGAFTLRGQCDSLLRSTATEESDLAASLSNIMESFTDCRARLQNIYNLRMPDLLTAVDAVL